MNCYTQRGHLIFRPGQIEYNYIDKKWDWHWEFTQHRQPICCECRMDSDEYEYRSHVCYNDDSDIDSDSDDSDSDDRYNDIGDSDIDNSDIDNSDDYNCNDYYCYCCRVRPFFAPLTTEVD